MHLTAEQNAKRFFETYVSQNNKDVSFLEIGSYLSTFNIRSLSPTNSKYVGVDLGEGPGVDVVLDDPYKLPFEDNTFDYVISSSCFEHSEFFWLTFLEVIRVLKPSGLFYMNVPSGGDFHRYPVDCWRFFPDSGSALSNWAKRNNYNTELIEQYTSDKESDIWADYVSIYIKDGNEMNRFPNRILNSFNRYSNGSIHPYTEIKNLVSW